MNSEVTEGIEVSVVNDFVPRLSRPAFGYFVFTYDITITNNNDYPVQLMSRKWFCVDSTGEVDMVEGEGVVGVKPELQPGETYTYQSGTHFTSPIGKMTGSYTFINKTTEEAFDVSIPEFQLVVPFVLN